MVLQMNPILFSFGSVVIRWYSLFILIAFVAVYTLFKKESWRFRVPQDFVFNLAFWIFILGILGARLWYVLFHLDYYSKNIIDIFKIWEGGLAIHGGIIAGVITMYFYCKKYNIRFSKITDISVISLILAQAIGRWGNFFNSEAHGPVTSFHALKGMHIIPDFVINGMNISGFYYVPVFYYESLWCILGLIVLLIIRTTKGLKLGTLTATYLMWYSAGRFVFESMRTDSLMIGPFKAAQIVSIIMFVIGLLIIMINSRKTPFEDLYNENAVATNFE